MRYCSLCEPDFDHQEGDEDRLCEEHDNDDLEEFEDERRRKLAERNEY